MAALRVTAVLAAVAALAAGAATSSPQQNEDTIMVSSGPIGNLSPDAAQLETGQDAGHNLAARGGGYNGNVNTYHNNHYYDYTYCFKWRGYCQSPYYQYNQDHAKYRCSPFRLGSGDYYYKPCSQVCCESAQYYNTGSGQVV